MAPPGGGFQSIVFVARGYFAGPWILLRSATGKLRMEGEEIIGDALCIGRGAEDFLFVVAEFADPVGDVGGAVGKVALGNA